MASDDGKGNVRFTNSRLPSEPAEAPKPVTAEGRVKAMMAIKAGASSIAPTQVAEAK